MNFEQALFDELTKIAMGYGGKDEKGREYHGTSHTDEWNMKRSLRSNKRKGHKTGIAQHPTYKHVWEDESPNEYKALLKELRDKKKVAYHHLLTRYS